MITFYLKSPLEPVLFLWYQMSLSSHFEDCFSMVHVRSTVQASAEVKVTVFALPVFLQTESLFLPVKLGSVHFEFQCCLFQ